MKSELLSTYSDQLFMLGEILSFVARTDKQFGDSEEQRKFTQGNLRYVASKLLDIYSEITDLADKSDLY